MVRPWDGFLTRAELIRLYGELSGRDMCAMLWSFALACYKLACLAEGPYARSLTRQIPTKVGAPVPANAVWLQHQAGHLISGYSWGKVDEFNPQLHNQGP